MWHTERGSATVVGRTLVQDQAWAIVNARLFAGVAAEPLLQHFGVHARCLMTIPLLIGGEAVTETISRR